MVKKLNQAGIFEVTTGTTVLVQASGSSCNICGTKTTPVRFVAIATNQTVIFKQRLYRRFDFLAGKKSICSHQKSWWITDGTTLVQETKVDADQRILPIS